MQTEAQKFMNQHGIVICYEADGRLFKHKENAEIAAAGGSLIEHTLNAGPRKEEPEQSNN